MCKRYVTGTEAGHCPGCGCVPPSVHDLITPGPLTSPDPRPSWLVARVLIAVLIAVLVALLVGR